MDSSTLVDMGTRVMTRQRPLETAITSSVPEAPFRALAAASTTRIWNLMINVIAQTGRFPSFASIPVTLLSRASDATVHVAIYRYRGKVLDERIKEVKE